MEPALKAVLSSSGTGSFLELAPAPALLSKWQFRFQNRKLEESKQP